MSASPKYGILSVVRGLWSSQLQLPMKLQNVFLVLASLCLGVQAAFDCKCKTDAKTTSCCNAEKFISSTQGDKKLMCYVNNLLAPIPASFPFKTCCGTDFELCR
ncbi:hypothetical protein CORC01_04955 [Colletotrichum orchidophilum]|uniref:Hydrophobin n=1 Tax=Colletotrichum orchidophilum TaxID=1209926 RepID=A0A1G4BEC3_9PEZI|nr:uncharacterized protein CORC01_04955 [Colletotrichum orchidophilum]OHE99819.1 hypothetical protein CORC01_04955 [Colletotrichum orchidophilum]